MKTTILWGVVGCLLFSTGAMAGGSDALKVKGFYPGMPKSDALRRFEEIAERMNTRAQDDTTVKWRVIQGQSAAGKPCNRVYIFRSMSRFYVPGPGNERDARGQFVFNEADEVTEVELEAECVAALFDLPDSTLKVFSEQFEEAYGLDKSRRVEQGNSRVYWDTTDGIRVTIGWNGNQISYFQLRCCASKEHIRSVLN
jgi:hypothetical protein